MGPEELPSRPKFSWDIRNPPWTDGKGPQDEYFNSVKLWKKFHDLLPTANSNKIPANLQGIMLSAQLYGRALDLAKKIPSDEIESEDGAMKVAGAVYKKDVLSLVTDTFQRFLDVLRTTQGENESYKNFENRFDAQVCRLNATCQGAELPSALVAFLLLANSRIDNTQRVSILSAAAPGSSVEIDIDKTTSEILSMISYNDIASIVRACDEPRKQFMSSGRNNSSLRSYGAQQTGYRTKQTRRPKQKLSPEQLADLKSKSICNRCKKRGHWASDIDKCPEASIQDTKLGKPSSSTISKESTITPKGTISFHMASISSNLPTTFHTIPGPLVDDAAPYSGIGIVEFKAIVKDVIPTWKGFFDPLPESVRDRPYWQYGRGKHASPQRKILGSINLSTFSDKGNEVNIRHLVIEGSSQWVIGRNVTRPCNIKHIGDNCIEFQLPNSSELDKITMVDGGDHSYIPAFRFGNNDVLRSNNAIVSLLCSVNTASLSWQDTKKIINKVHQHVCGHATYEDMKLLLSRNHLWTPQCMNYLSHLLDQCESCTVVRAPSGSRKVSLHSMSSEFNEIACVDHFFPDNLDVLHIMDAKTRYSNGNLVSSTAMSDAISVFDSTWLSEFWPPGCVQADKAFDNQEFKDYLVVNGIDFRPVPPRRHSKNVLESKHRILRDIYLRLKDANPNEERSLLISQMFRISNNLYGNTVASAHELAKGYTRPIIHAVPRLLPEDIRHAHEEIVAKRKLNLILSSKSIEEIPIKIGDFVQIYTKLSKQKRGTWSTPQPVLHYDRLSRTVTIPGSHGRTRQASIEDVRHAISENEFAVGIQEAIDRLSIDIDEAIDHIDDDIDEPSKHVSFNDNIEIIDLEDSSYGHEQDSEIENEQQDGQHDQATSGLNVDDISPNQTQDHEITIPDVAVSDDQEVIQESLTYYPSQQSNFDPDEPSSSIDQAQHGSSNQDNWSQPPAPSVHQMSTRSQAQQQSEDAQEADTDSRILEGNDIELLPGTELSSMEQEALKKYQVRFRNKEFLLHQAEGLPTFIITNSYNVEEENFKKQCEIIHSSDVPPDANVIGSHVLYKIKQRDDDSFTCKARIAPHGNEDRDRESLRTDSASCPPLGIRILFSICVLFQWYLTKIDVKGAFLQSGSAMREVYVIPPKECSEKQFVWLLNVATYGLVNANAKWQVHSDNTFIKLGLGTVVYVTQLFFLMSDVCLALIVVKIVDDIFAAGEEEVKRRFINQLGKASELGTITNLRGTCLFYGMRVTQGEDYTVVVHADEKLRGISPHILSRVRRKQAGEHLNALELSRFNSVNGSIGFIGTHASPFASFVASYLQQKRNCALVKDISLHSTMLRQLQQLGSVISYKRPHDVGEYDLSVLVFCDASRPSEYGQLGVLVGLLISKIAHGSVYHVLSWSSRLSRRPANSIGSAEIFAAGSGIDDAMLASFALSSLFDCSVSINVAVDSKDLFYSLSSCRLPEDKSIRADVQLIRYYFETRKIHKIIWIPGHLNLVDPLTKRNSPLTDALQLTLYDGPLPFDVHQSEERCSTQNLG